MLLSFVSFRTTITSMPFQHGLAEGLQADLLALSTDGSDRPALTRVVAVCHALAFAFLRSKASVRALAANNDLRHSDLAYDCIAELFQQNEEGAFIQIRAYFAGLPLRGLTDEEAAVHLRRLVFARVNHGVFRIFNEFDPGLGRILRNLKLAMHALRSFEETERFGEARIRPALADPLEHLPPPGREEIIAALRPTARRSGKIPDLLAALAITLRSQDRHARSVPLMDVALAIRELYAADPERAASPQSASAGLHTEDARRLVRATCARVRTAMYGRYVGRGKASEETYAHYFTVIEQGLIARFVAADGEEFSYFEGLQARLPGLTREEYRKRYKSHMEYLGRVTSKEALETLKKEI